MANHDSAERARPLSLRVLVWASPLAGVVALATAGMTAISTQFPGGPSSTEIVYQLIFAVVVFAVPALWLLVAGLRARRHPGGGALPVVGIVVAALCLVVGGVSSAPALSQAISDEVTTARLRSNAPTAAETAYTPRELKAEAETVLAESVASVGAEVPTGEELSFYTDACVTSNLERGTAYSAVVSVSTAIDRDVWRAVITQWERMGFTIESSMTARNAVDLPYVRATGGIMQSLSFTEIASGDGLVLSFDTRCVLGR